MARTLILPTDPGAVKLFTTEVALDVAKKSYFSSKMEGGETSKLPILRKTDLESGAGTEVTCQLVAKLRGRPIQGQEKLEGREMRLSHYTDKVVVDKFRNGVNVGDVMTQKQVKWNVRDQAKAKLADYIAELEDELVMMFAAGTRGTGDEIQNFPKDWIAFPNAFESPDAGHYFAGAGASAAALAATDKMSTNFLDRVQARAKRFIGIEANGAKMHPVSVEGGNHFVVLMSIEQMFDLRREVGDAGWLTLQKAAMAANGAKNPVFTGSAGMYNDLILHEHQNVIKTSGNGAGANIEAARALVFGAHAVLKAYGMKGNDGVRYKLSESGIDHDEEAIIHFRSFMGVKKSRYKSMDFGQITLDTAYTAVS